MFYFHLQVEQHFLHAGKYDSNKRFVVSVCKHKCGSKHDTPQIFPEEWLHINKLVSILEPFEEVTINMSESTTSISSVISRIYILKHSLQLQESKPDTNEQLNSRFTIEKLNSRFVDLYFNNYFLIAIYLDPRYKTKFFNEVNLKHVESELISLLDSTDNSVNHAEGKDAEAPGK